MSQGLESIDLGHKHDDLIAMRVTGDLHGEDMVRFNALLAEINNAGRKARFYLEMDHIPGFDLDVIREKTHNLPNIWQGLEKVAYVVDKQWMTRALSFIDAITPMHIRAFTHEEKAAAVAWLLQDD